MGVHVFQGFPMRNSKILITKNNPFPHKKNQKPVYIYLGCNVHIQNICMLQGPAVHISQLGKKCSTH